MKPGGRTGAPGKGRVPKAGSGGGVPGAGGGRRIGVWRLGDTCKVRSAEPHHAVPGWLRVQVDLDSRESLERFSKGLMWSALHLKNIVLEALRGTVGRCKGLRGDLLGWKMGWRDSLGTLESLQVLRGRLGFPLQSLTKVPPEESRATGVHPEF